MSRSLPGAASAALLALLWAGISLLVVAAPAQASALRVVPLQLNLNLKQPISRIELFNDGATDTVVDLRVQAWSQVDGQDRLTPTDEVIAIPPVARVAAGKQQLVRVGFRRPELAGARERAYRLVITELPPPNPGASALQLQLRLLIPVFLAPRGPEQRQLPLRLRADGDGLRLEAVNRGNVHAKLTGVALRDAQQRTLLSAPLSAYLLPGTARSLPLPPQSGAVSAAQAQVLQGAQLQAETLPVELP